jgi:tetratricopeptide (TPR) repeat protein
VGAEGASFALGWGARLLVAGHAVWFYLGQLAWPARLNFIYPRWNPDPAAAAQWLYPLAALALGGLLWAIRGRTRGPLAAYLFFVGSLLPVLGIVSLYGQLYSWVWDHWQYLPDLGPIALAGGALVTGWQRLPRAPSGLGAAAGAALVLGSLTWAHCAPFHDNETLYRSTLRRNPGAWMAHNNLGLLLSHLPGRSEDAAAEYEAALKLKPDIATTHVNLGNIWIRQPGRADDAIAEYEEAIRLDPNSSDAHFYLANALVPAGRTEEAIRHFEISLQLEPARAEVSTNLGIVLCRTGRVREGLARIEAAIRIQPDYAPAYVARGLVFYQSGQRAAAAADFRRVLELHPGDPAALRLLSQLGEVP